MSVTRAKEARPAVAQVTKPTEPDALRPSAARLTLRHIAKGLIGVALIAAMLLWQDNGQKLLGILAGFQVQYLIALLGLQVLLSGVSSIKWHLFLRDRGVRVTQLALFRLYLIGRFFNNFLPSMVGGDVTRVYLLGREIKSQAVSAASVTMERATGSIALVALAVFFAALNPSAFRNPVVIVTIAAAFVACAVAVTVFASEHAGRRMDRFLSGRTGRGGRIAGKLARLVQEIGAYRGRRRVLWRSLAYSCLFQFLAGLNVYFACLSIDFRPELLDILVVTPAILILAMIPVSPNNVGWWEWCFSVLLIDAGATAAEGLAVALTLRAASWITALAGGVLFLMQKD